ncbi:MAG: CdaR family protein [Vicinamibacterales bacterium]
MRYHPFRNLGLKVFSIALASLLWLTVAGEHVVERSVRVPLEFRNVPEALDIVGNAPQTVDVTLRGSSAVLNRLEAGEIVAVIDLSRARPGARLFHIMNDEVRAPFGVEVAQVFPATLPLDLEASLERSVPVVPAVEGVPAPGYVVGRISSDPATVAIVGPETHVRQIASATTESVSIAGARSRVRDNVTIGVADSAVRLAGPLSANVIVEIGPAPEQRQIARIPVRWRDLRAGLQAQIAPATVDVTIRGTKAALDEVASDAVQPFVDLAGLGAGRYNLRVQVDASRSFGVTAITPDSVTVTIR